MACIPWFLPELSNLVGKSFDIPIKGNFINPLSVRSQSQPQIKQGPGLNGSKLNELLCIPSPTFWLWQVAANELKGLNPFVCTSDLLILKYSFGPETGDKRLHYSCSLSSLIILVAILLLIYSILTANLLTILAINRVPIPINFLIAASILAVPTTAFTACHCNNFCFPGPLWCLWEVLHPASRPSQLATLLLP
ncbi:hypothetical protein BDM02DRAFT_3192738 [Thelephora ganbajun]|uniref:Uncharacterized protein n=1 Tax=Thelephora ganbajun TaxID=370292 RepID=A0ACB6YZN8_THEGA|nr:hypothetical protein BDM02DRAFT_3192738 [Thelephora ganbajun]